MTQSNYLSTDLDKLIELAIEQLKSLGYSRKSLFRYNTTWRHFIEFARQKHKDHKYSEELAVEFVQENLFKDSKQVKDLKGWQVHMTFSMKVLGDFARNGHIERPRIYIKNSQTSSALKRALHDYKRYCTDRLHLRASSMELRLKEIIRFLEFLDARSILSFEQVKPIDLSEFIVSKNYMKPKTVSRIVSDLRSFLKFLLLRGSIQKDLSEGLPKIRVPQDSTIPSAWDNELIVKLLGSVDRSSPKGKRDYAILILASHLGLRVGDIRLMTLDNLKWDTETIEIIQSKTETPLSLPLTKEVGEALIDYLKSGRPKSKNRTLFLKLLPPFEPFGENNHLHYIVKYWREIAGIKFRTKQHHGMHSLRHTLATRLLKKETPFHIISEILGHASTKTTMIYAKADVESLRGVALNGDEEVKNEHI